MLLARDGPLSVARFVRDVPAVGTLVRRDRLVELARQRSPSEVRVRAPHLKCRAVGIERAALGDRGVKAGADLQVFGADQLLFGLRAARAALAYNHPAGVLRFAGKIGRFHRISSLRGVDDSLTAGSRSSAAPSNLRPRATEAEMFPRCQQGGAELMFGLPFVGDQLLVTGRRCWSAADAEGTFTPDAHKRVSAAPFAPLPQN